MPYKNAEKRKAKSRDAARCRRGKEADVFSELSNLVPVSPETVATMDKASVMRLAISHLKLRTLMGGFENDEGKEVEADLDCQYEKALSGFLVVMDKEGEFVYVSENVVKHIGLNQLDLMGQTILEYSHPCDHEEIEEFLAEKHSTDKEGEEELPQTKTFFARLKCTLTNKGKNVNLKSATYKVIRFRGHRLVNMGLDCWLLIGESIPHPSHVNEPIENTAIITRHSLDMKFTYCDERMEEELGYSSEELDNKSLFEFHHALDGDYMDKIFKDLYSKGQVWTDHYRFLVKRGGFKWIETQATVVHNPKTDKPQYIICVHHVLSGIEEEGKILSTVQEPGKVSSAAKKKAQGNPKSVKVSHGPILSTESIFVPRTKEMDRGICAPKQKLKEEMETEMGQIAPTAGEEIIPLFEGQENDMVSLLQDVLLQASELDNKKMLPFPLSMEEDQSSQPAGKTPEAYFTTPTGNKQLRLSSLENVTRLDTQPTSTVASFGERRRPSTTHSLASCLSADSGIQEDITDKTVQIRKWLKSVENSLCKTNALGMNSVARNNTTTPTPVYTNCTTALKPVASADLHSRLVCSVSASTVTTQCATSPTSSKIKTVTKPCSMLCGTLNHCVTALPGLVTPSSAGHTCGSTFRPGEERRRSSSTETCSLSDWETETASEKADSDFSSIGFDLADFFDYNNCNNSSPENETLSLDYDFLQEETELHNFINDLDCTNYSGNGVTESLPTYFNCNSVSESTPTISGGRGLSGLTPTTFHCDDVSDSTHASFKSADVPGSTHDISNVNSSSGQMTVKYTGTCFSGAHPVDLTDNVPCTQELKTCTAVTHTLDSEKSTFCSMGPGNETYTPVTSSQTLVQQSQSEAMDVFEAKDNHTRELPGPLTNSSSLVSDASISGYLIPGTSGSASSVGCRRVNPAYSRHNIDVSSYSEPTEALTTPMIQTVLPSHIKAVSSTQSRLDVSTVETSTYNVTSKINGPNSKREESNRRSNSSLTTAIPTPLRRNSLLFELLTGEDKQC